MPAGLSLKARFGELWRRAIGSHSADTAWRALDERYAAPERAYHGWSHLGAMLAGLDEARGVAEFAAVEFDPVELAIFFHDAIYDARAKDNEEKSAAMFLEMAGITPAMGERGTAGVAEMIRATATHGAIDDLATRLLLDLDLRVLGGTASEYAAYVDAVRREYAFVPDDQWRVGRAAVLERFLERPAIFQTAHFAARYEERAGENIRRDVKALREG